MFEFLPDVGLRLPGRAGVLRLGMDERAAQRAVATVADVREGWVCGAGWTFTARYEGLTLHAHGDTWDRHGRHEDVSGLAGIGLTRPPGTPDAGAGGCPVVLRGIDLFGYPAAEVLEALGSTVPPTLRLRADGEGRFLTTASLHAPAPLGDSASRPA
ncbi:hypothetical protein [Streptomyces sp. NPDC053048]|uniref:hypothetical protein n=1 Tax=Streptomyces sp. NPDC053048 TaxID=3365694 RepID=UPI0037D974DC